MQTPPLLPLPKGITGFSGAAEPCPSSLDSKFVKSIVFSLEHTQPYKIMDFQTPQGSANYFRLNIENSWTNDIFSILLNAHFPFYSAVTIDSQWMALEFKEAPAAIQEILNPHFVYLNLKDLNQIARPEHLVLLGKAELQQIAHWKSERVGDIVFNGYD